VKPFSFSKARRRGRTGRRLVCVCCRSITRRVSSTRRRADC